MGVGVGAKVATGVAAPAAAGLGLLCSGLAAAEAPAGPPMSGTSCVLGSVPGSASALAAVELSGAWAACAGAGAGAAGRLTGGAGEAATAGAGLAAVVAAGWLAGGSASTWLAQVAGCADAGEDASVPA